MAKCTRESNTRGACRPPNRRLTVRLLAAGAGARAAELLRLASARVSDEQAAIVRDEDLLNLLLLGLVDVFLVVRHDRLGDRLPDGVDLRRVATTLDADAQVHDGEALAAEQQDRLEDLVAQQLRLHQLNGAAVDLD